MRKLLNYVFWPALAGLVFAAAFLALPLAVSYLPGLARLLPEGIEQEAPAGMHVASYSAAIKRAAPAVVSINSQQSVVRTVETYDLNNPFAPHYRKMINESNSLGSGVIISPDGYIITSYHIFHQPDTPLLSEDSTVTLYNGKTVKARVLALDEENDLALLKVDEENLPFISIDAHTSQEVGDVVLAIGNPRNIGQSVSMGIVSALLRRDDSFVIQTDAAINPGNSGGALIDTEGRLIGINSTIVSESGGSEGIGFATPAVEALRLMERYTPGGYLGIDINMQYDPNENNLSVKLVQVQDGERSVRGILVSGVFSNGPAEKAGISCGDIVTAIDGMTTDSVGKALEAITYTSSKKPGEQIEVEVFRYGRVLRIPVTLGVGEPTLEYPLDPRAGGCTLSAPPMP